MLLSKILLLAALLSPSVAADTPSARQLTTSAPPRDTENEHSGGLPSVDIPITETGLSTATSEPESLTIGPEPTETSEPSSSALSGLSESPATSDNPEDTPNLELPDILPDSTTTTATHQSTQSSSSEEQTTTSSHPTSTISLNDLLGSGSSGGPLGDISKLLDGVTGLLAPNLLSDLEEVVHDAAHLLRAPTTNNTKTLLGTAFDLLNPDTADQIVDAVHTLQRIITPAVVHELEQANLAQVLSEVGEFYTHVKTLLTSEAVDELEKLDLAAIFKEIERVYTAAKGILSSEAIKELEKLDLGEIFKDIGQLYGTVKNLLNGAGGLLSETSIKDIESILNNVTKLLSGHTVQDIESVLSGAAKLLSGNLVGDIEGIVGYVRKLLSGKTIEEITSIVSRITGLLSGDTIKDVEGILDAVDDLLSPEVVNSLKTLLSSLGPLISKVKPILGEIQPLLGDIIPVIRKIGPLIGDIGPLFDKIEPFIKDIKPYISKIQSYITPENINRLGGLVVNAENLLGAIAPVVTPQLIDNIETILKSVSRHFTPAVKTKIRNLISTVWSMLTPDGIERAATLVNSLEGLVTPAAVQGIKDIVGLVAPFITKDNISKVQRVISYVKSIVPDVSQVIKKLWDYVSGDVIQNIKTIYSKLDVLFSAIGPAITRQNMHRLGGLVNVAIDLLTPKFANETTGLIDAASGLLNSQFLTEAEDVLKSLDKIDPGLFDDVGTVLKSAADVRAPFLSLFLDVDGG